MFVLKTIATPMGSDEFKLGEAEETARYCERNVNTTHCVSKYFDTSHANLQSNDQTLDEISTDVDDSFAMPKTVDSNIENDQNESQDSGIHNNTQDSQASQDCENFSYGSILYDSDEESNHELISSQFFIEADQKIVIEPFFNITPREMPESPHHVFEEEFMNNPWVMLVATIFLTKTAGKVARPFMREFFQNFPTPLHVLNSDPACLETYFEKLGLRKRGTMIWKMSFQFISGKWRRASDLYGIGKYGEDAYRIFCLGHHDIEPTDRYLRLYLDWLKYQTDFTESWSVADSEKLIVDPIEKYYKISLR